MNEAWWAGLLGSGWVGKAIAGVLAFVGAWYLRRPAEHAAVLLAVDKRVETLMEALERQLGKAVKRCDDLEGLRLADRQDCDRELDDMREDMRLEREQLRREIAALMGGAPAPDYTELKRPEGI